MCCLAQDLRFTLVDKPALAPSPDAAPVLADIPVGGADGFMLAPQAVQMALTSFTPNSGLPVALAGSMLPSVAASVAAAIIGKGASVLVPSGGAGIVAGMEGVQYSNSTVGTPPTQPLDLSQLVYSLEWQAAADFSRALQQGAAVAARKRLRHGTKRRRRALTSLQLNQDAAVAAADVLRVLHSHGTLLQKSIALQAVGSLAATARPGAEFPAVAAAAVAGMLKNLLYELPTLRGHVLDLDNADQQAAGPVYTVAAAALPEGLQTDVYGVAARGGVLHHPLLIYQQMHQPANHQPMLECGTVHPRSAHIVTGGTAGLGLLTASWLAGSGSSTLVLLSRSGLAASSPEAAPITCSTAPVTAAKCDVSRSDDAHLAMRVARCLSHPPGGIIHAAGLQASKHVAKQQGAVLSRKYKSGCTAVEGVQQSWPLPRRWRHACPNRACAQCGRPQHPSWERCRTVWMLRLVPPWWTPSSSPQSLAWWDWAATPTMRRPMPRWMHSLRSRLQLVCAPQPCSGVLGRA